MTGPEALSAERSGTISLVPAAGNIRAGQSGDSAGPVVGSGEARRRWTPKCQRSIPQQEDGVTIQFERHRVELAEIYEMEHNAECLEYYDQPPPIKLDYQAASGKRLGVLHTPDYFTIRTTGAGWVECKTEEDLGRLSERNPNRYRLQDGRWRCPPGEAYASPLGLDYTVRSSRDINWVFQANIQFLEDYFVDGAAPPSGTVESVRSHVAAAPGIKLDDLLTAVAGSCCRDWVYWLIARDQLFVTCAPPASPSRRLSRCSPTLLLQQLHRGRTCWSPSRPAPRGSSWRPARWLRGMPGQGGLSMPGRPW